MKKLILVVCSFFALNAAFAQQTTQTATAPKATPQNQVNYHQKAQVKNVAQTQQAHVKQVANPAAYACPKCFMISKGAGICDHCNADKVQLGTYYCMKCNKATGSKPGKCATCSGATTQITRKYCAAHGGTPAKTKGVHSNM